MVPKFTENGFEVMEIPEPWRTKLAKAVEEPLKNFKAIRTEGNIDVIYHPPGSEPKFLNLGKTSDHLVVTLWP